MTSVAAYPHPASGRVVWQALAAECLGTAMLLCTVIGSGIMAERLANGNTAVALLANTVATVFALVVLIETLGPISGAHFNPVVTALMGPPERLQQAFSESFRHSVSVFTHFLAVFFIAAQILGAVLGCWLAHAMFELPVLQFSQKLRAGPGQLLAESVATASLLFVIARCGQRSVDREAMAPSILIGCTIGAAYWFTASTSFANPAAVVGRMLSDTFAGIAPASALGFVGAQLAGGLVGLAVAKQLRPAKL